MAEPDFDQIVRSIDENLTYLHKERWDAHAAELRADEAAAQGGDVERVREALREHYANRFRPETSRAPLIEQARKNYADRSAA